MFIYLAFVFIDLIISTLLMYLGMMMVPPMILSLPFKILVFVYLGGYTKLSILCLRRSPEAFDAM